MKLNWYVFSVSYPSPVFQFVYIVLIFSRHCQHSAFDSFFFSFSFWLWLLLSCPPVWVEILKGLKKKFKLNFCVTSFEKISLSSIWLGFCCRFLVFVILLYYFFVANDGVCICARPYERFEQFNKLQFDTNDFFPLRNLIELIIKYNSMFFSLSVFFSFYLFSFALLPGKGWWLIMVRFIRGIPFGFVVYALNISYNQMVKWKHTSDKIRFVVHTFDIIR